MFTNKPKNDTLYLIITILILCLIIFLKLRYCTAIVDGYSMYSTLDSGDYLVIDKYAKPNKSDIVAVVAKDKKSYYIKRVIATSGDTIKIDNGKLYINNTKITEPYIYEQNWGKDTQIDLTLKDGEYFVMGDNRNNSYDSRELGVFYTDELVGVLQLDITSKYNLTFYQISITLKVLLTVLIVLVGTKLFIDISKGESANE